MMRRSFRSLTLTVALMCALTVGGRAANLTLQKGQEFVLSGSGKFALQSGEQRTNVKFTVKENRLVTEASDAGSKMVIAQEFADESGGKEAGFLVAEFGADGKAKSEPTFKFEPSSVFCQFGPMPPAFPREVKEGDKWDDREKIGLLALPSIMFPVTYRVVGAETVGGVDCWKVEKTINERLPDTRSINEGAAEITYESFVERFWVGKSQPLLARWERAIKVTYKEGGVAANYEHAWDLALQSQKTLTAQEMAGREEQLKALDAITAKLDSASGANALQTLKSAEEDVNAFKSKYPESPYQVVVPQMTADIAGLKQDASRPTTGPFSVVLTELNSGKKVSLWDLRGKVILLNFFASW